MSPTSQNIPGATRQPVRAAIASFAGTTIEWDAAAMKAKNVPSADQYIKRDYRKGFSIF